MDARVESLIASARSTGFRTVNLPSGGKARIEELRIRFPTAQPLYLPKGVLPATFTRKRLILADGLAIFGELAIARLLNKDGWEAVWVDTFHREFWSAMPNESQPVQLPTAAKRKYDEIVKVNAKAGGFFDVMAWRGEQFLFVEYKGPGDFSNANESRWIESAPKAGVREPDLMFVIY